MSDIITCSRCGKETNRFAPCCEHCLAPIPKEAPAAPDNAAPGSIQGQANTLHESMEKAVNRMKKCPFCAEEINFEAIKCRFCGERLKVPAAGKGPNLTPVWIALAAIAAVAVIATALVLIWPGISSITLDRKGPLQRIPETSAALKADKVKALYVNRSLSLTGIGTLEESEQRSDNTVKYAYAAIKNSGDKILIRLQVTVYYLNKNGRIIAEHSAWPVFGAKGKPDSVKPGASKEFQILIPNTNPEWAGRIKMRITDIELADL